MTTTALQQDYLAPIGEKITNIPALIRYAKYNAGSWNRSATMFIIAETPEGQTIKISGASQSLFGLARGDEVLILQAKVKDHGEYRGVPQTILSHVKVERPIVDEPDEPELEPQPGPREDPLATTTLAKFANARRVNYETLPTIDVEILPDVHHCESCGGEIVFNADSKASWNGSWEHVDKANSEKPHRGGWISPKTRCRYCHAEAPIAVYRQHAWHDAVECSRCSGHDGRAIGD